MRTERWFFVFFLVSGFCSLVYEVVWLRLAMAGFGVTTPLVSIVLSVFMGGLALGSWAGGRLARSLADPSGASALRLYALAELVIGVSGIVVPHELRWGRELLAGFGENVTWASGTHYLASAVWVTLALLPYCTAMGATFPLAMEALRRRSPENADRSFSYLYLANVIGATSGTLVSAFVLIELLGFRGTGVFAAVLNGLLVACAIALSRSKPSAVAAAQPQPTSRAAGVLGGPDPALPWMLFTTGLVSMGMEVIWVRQFTPFLGTVVYAFAAILALYLAGTFLGSAAYRSWLRPRTPAESTATVAQVWIAAFLFALLPLLFADPRPTSSRLVLIAVPRVALGIMPFCAAVGFLTPMLVDRWSAGDPDRAGSVYAMNIIGCILGPLVACFLLLPVLGERWSIVALSLPIAAIGLALALRSESLRRAAVPRAPAGGSKPFPLRPIVALAGAGVLGLVLIFSTKDFESVFPRREVRRDYTATVIAAGEDMDKRLLINGEGITTLTPITKLMAHLPLASLGSPPQKALVICFGMGTSFRSSLSWGIPCTAVDLIPSVPALFGYFHADAPRVLGTPGARIVVDDGRRFLERSTEKFDVVTIDPPPPVEAAGSSLLYSREFYQVVQDHLAPHGILQQWLPGRELTVLTSVAKALGAQFPHVRVFRSMQGWGFHFLASMEPIPARTASELVARLPYEAAADLVEWLPSKRPQDYFEAILSQEIALDVVANLAPGTPALEDNRPVNEYFFLRWLAGKRQYEAPEIERLPRPPFAGPASSAAVIGEPGVAAPGEHAQRVSISR